MNTKIIICLFAATLLSTAHLAEAQQPMKIPRIGILLGGSSFLSVRVEAFRQGLKELGYIEGRNVVIEHRYAEGKADRLPALAAELMGLQVDGHRCCQHTRRSGCQKSNEYDPHCVRIGW